MLRYLSFLLIFSLTGCSILEHTETREYQMTWRIDESQKNDEHVLVELSFVKFPGHILGQYSNQLAKHLRENGKKQVSVVLEVTRNLFNEVSFSEVELAGLTNCSSTFSYHSTQGDPEKSPLD